MELLALAAAAGLAWLVLRSPAAADKGSDAYDYSGGLQPMDPGELLDDGDFHYEYRPSPNRSSRGKSKATTLVWHYTAGQTLEGAVRWLCDPSAKASAHFVVGRDGRIVQLVPLAWAAWHAGGATVHNASSVGVEIVNPGIVRPDGAGGWVDTLGQPWTPDGVTPVQRTLRFPNGKSVTEWWVPYTAAQWRACAELLRELEGSRYAAVCRDQRGHADIAAPEGRKTDPGPLFPWETLVAFSDRRGGTKVV